MFNLIHKIIISKVVANMCTCAILSLLKRVINIANNDCRYTKNYTKHIRDVPRGGTSAKATDGSIRTSRYNVLLEVVGHSWCRKRFAVQSHERPRRKRRYDPRAYTRKKATWSRKRPPGRRPDDPRKETKASSHGRRSPKTVNVHHEEDIPIHECTPERRWYDPASVHQEEDETIQGRRQRQAVVEDASQKPDYPHTREGVSMRGVGFRRPALPISPCA